MVWIARFEVVNIMDADEEITFNNLLNSYETVENEIDDLVSQITGMSERILELTTTLREVAAEVARMQGKALGMLFTLPKEGNR